MDYRAFYTAIADWIEQNQQMTVQFGFGSQAYFEWVYQSAGELGNQFGNTELVLKQMNMLLNWIEDSYEKQNC